MNEELNVLIVDDSAADAELMLFKIFEAGYKVDHALVDNASDLKKKLVEKPWDILFCDYSLPDFDPYSALEIIREFDIDIPLIAISGTIGEENAVELMRSGFHDCVMKNNLGKLPEVVSREIREARVRRDNRLLQKRIQKYQLLAEEISDAIFFIDGEGNILEANNAAIKNYGYSREEFLTMRIFELRCPDNKEISLKEMEKANNEGIVFETIHFRKDGSAIDVEVNSHSSSLEGKQVMLSIVRDITARRLAQNAMAASLEKYRKLLDGIVTALSAVVEVRDPYTSGHQNRVSKLATAIALELGFDEDIVETVRITGLLHDIGKMYVPTELLVKPTKLSSLEYEIIKIHSEAGYNILKSVDFTGPIAEIVYQHHERMNGSGYPRKLKAGELLMEARIISVADVVEAMMSHRPYRPARSFNEAFTEIEHGAGTLYDRDCVTACLNLFRDKGYQL